MRRNETSNGLAHVIDRFSKENYPFYTHITLEKGERSDLASIGWGFFLFAPLTKGVRGILLLLSPTNTLSSPTPIGDLYKMA